jgi:selenocysteine-specific elongation factor
VHVIGTAGHVDHGKSTLVKALTGIDPDRLKEEQQREMTIDLGFAWMKLPGGEDIGIVDVPGHRDFIENMLAGMSGIDLVLLVIAADEGVMPQTREHLAIIDLLGIRSGIIVLTKSDLISDPQWMELVQADIKKLVANTVLENKPILSVSARKGAGLAELVHTIETELLSVPIRTDSSRPRLAIDRVFSLTGFGTVVTGTLLDGKLCVGDEIEILPSGLHARIRGLQTHKQKEEEAAPGSRTAVNISGLEVDQIHRGEVLTQKGTYATSHLLDVSFHLLAGANSPLHHQDEVKLFIGSAEINARVKVLNEKELDAEKQGFLQLELRKPTVAVKGDRFILRRPSPPETLGGGVILDPAPLHRYKRKSLGVVEKMQILQNGSPADGLVQTIIKLGVTTVEQVRQESKLSPQAFIDLFEDLIRNQQIVKLFNKNHEADENTLLVSVQTLEEISLKIKYILIEFFKKNPYRLGLKKEELKGRFSFSQREFDALVNYFVGNQTILLKGNLVCLPDHKIHFSPTQEKAIKALTSQFDQSPFEPPSVEDCIKQVGKDVFQSLLDMQELILVSPDIVFQGALIRKVEEELRSLLISNGKIALAEVRDKYKTSRKFALAMLEHLDRVGITIREGDFRRLKKSG